MKRGQRFEDNFRNSIDRESKDLFFYRFKDGTANWNPNEKTRFQAHNICDCMIFYKHKLFLFELKSHKGKSLPFNCIRNSQYDEMCFAGTKENVFPFLITFFSDIGECYAIHIREIYALRTFSNRKSIPLSYFIEKAYQIEIKYIPRLDYIKIIEKFGGFYNET